MPAPMTCTRWGAAHISPWRKASQSFAGFESLTGSAKRCQPRGAQPRELRVIDRAHRARRPHRAARALRHRRARIGEMLLGDARRAHRRHRRGWDGAARPSGSVATMPASHQQIARQIEPAALGILGEIAQDVGELQRAAEMMRDAIGRRAGHRRRARTDILGPQVSAAMQTQSAEGIASLARLVQRQAPAPGVHPGIGGHTQMGDAAAASD